jgi:DNA-binding transcriptional LysR family regulator
MDFEIIREYLEFCKFMNYTRAAQYLNMSQTTLNRHIHDLEKEVGVKLVSSEGNAHLTPAGQSVFSDAERLVKEYDEMLARGRKRGKRKVHSLKYSCWSWNRNFSDIIDLAADSFDEEWEISTTRIDIAGKSMRESLDCGDVDVVCMYTDDVGDEYEAIPLFDERTIVAVDKRNPYSKRESLTLENLERFAKILWIADKSLEGWLDEYFFPLCNRHHVHIPVSYIVGDLHDYFTFSDENGVFMFGDTEVYDYGTSLPRKLFATHSLIKLAGDDCRFTTYAVYRRDNPDPSVPLLVEGMREKAGEIPRSYHD